MGLANKTKLLAVLLAPFALGAQPLTNPVQDYINKTTLLNNILSNARATAMSQQAQTGGSAAGSKTPAPTAPDPTAFTHSGSALLPKQLSAKAGAGTEHYFASLVALYEQTARQDGFPPNDLAYALEYFVVNTYMTYHDLHDAEYSKDPRAKRGKDMFERLTLMNEKKLLKVTLPQERAIYQQFRTTLAASPTVRQMTDRQKQELTELLAITFGVNLKAYMDAVNGEDDRARQLARQQAKMNLEKLTGAPIERIQIGPGGVQL